MEKYIEIIQRLAQEKGVTINKVLSSCDINLSGFDTWKKGVAKPSLISLVKLADYFDVTIDYLIGRNDYNNYLTMHELDLIDTYRTLTDENKAVCHAHTEFLFEQQIKPVDYAKLEQELKERHKKKGGGRK